MTSYKKAPNSKSRRLKPMTNLIPMCDIIIGIIPDSGLELAQLDPCMAA
jgi:hypothetical protein